MVQLVAVQHAVPEQSLVPLHTIEQLELAAPPHRNAPEQADEPHVMAHVCAEQVTLPEQVESPHATVQLEPAQLMLPEHELAPHSMSQLEACVQSTVR